MGTAYIEQYGNIVEDRNGNEAQIPGSPMGTEPTLKVTTSGTTARSGADFESNAEFLIISADVDVQFELGDSTVTADANSRILYAGTYREVSKDGATRIAFIDKQ